MTANEVKTKHDIFRVYEIVSDNLTNKSFDDPDNEELEAFAEKAYEAMWAALDDFADALAEFTNGQIDHHTARRLAVNIKYRDRLASIMSRLAA